MLLEVWKLCLSLCQNFGEYSATYDAGITVWRHNFWRRKSPHQSWEIAARPFLLLKSAQSSFFFYGKSPHISWDCMRATNTPSPLFLLFCVQTVTTQSRDPQKFWHRGKRVQMTDLRHSHDSNCQPNLFMYKPSNEYLLFFLPQKYRCPFEFCNIHTCIHWFSLKIDFFQPRLTTHRNSKEITAFLSCLCSHPKPKRKWKIPT